MSYNNKKQREIDLIKIKLLKDGGVDNWPGYGFSIEDYYEMNELDEDYDLDELELLWALESGGVDNWDWFYESLGDAFFDWIDHVDEFYDTEEYMDYYEFESQYKPEPEEEE